MAEQQACKRSCRNCRQPIYLDVDVWRHEETDERPCAMLAVPADPPAAPLNSATPRRFPDSCLSGEHPNCPEGPNVVCPDCGTHLAKSLMGMCMSAPPAPVPSARERINLAELATSLSSQAFAVFKGGGSDTAIQGAIHSGLARAELQGRDAASAVTAAKDAKIARLQVAWLDACDEKNLVRQQLQQAEADYRAAIAVGNELRSRLRQAEQERDQLAKGVGTAQAWGEALGRKESEQRIAELEEGLRGAEWRSGICDECGGVVRSGHKPACGLAKLLGKDTAK